MKKEICFDRNQLIRTMASYLFNVVLRHVHSELVSSERNETEILKVPILIEHIWETFFSNKHKKLIKQKFVHMSNIE